MIEAIEIEEHEIAREEGEPLTLQYGLLCEAQPGMDQYGIFIRERRSGEYATARAISPNGEKVLHLVKLLAQNTVTPCTLHEILQEIL